MLQIQTQPIPCGHTAISFTIILRFHQNSIRALACLKKTELQQQLPSLLWVLPGSDKPREPLRPDTRTPLLTNHLGALPAPLLSARAKISAAESTVNSARQVVCKMRSTGCWLLVKHKFSSSFPHIKMKEGKKNKPTLFFFQYHFPV